MHVSFFESTMRLVLPDLVFYCDILHVKRATTDLNEDISFVGLARQKGARRCFRIVLTRSCESGKQIKVMHLAHAARESRQRAPSESRRSTAPLVIRLALYF